MMSIHFDGQADSYVQNENLPKRDITSLLLGPFLKRGWNV